MVTGRPSMARKIPLKSSRCMGFSLSSAARSSARRSGSSAAMIMSRTIGMRSVAKNMCSVRTSPMPSAPNERARAASSGVSALARTPSLRYRSAQPRNSWANPLTSGVVRSIASRITSPVSPSMAITSPSRTMRPPASNTRRSSWTTMSLAPTMHGLPMPTATTAACEVRPPRAVTMPSAAYMPATSSGEVSGRTRITCWPFFASSTARSASNTTWPTAPPGAAGRPRARSRPPSSARCLSRGSSRGTKSLARSRGFTRRSAVCWSMTASCTRSTATFTAAAADRLPARVCRR